MSDPRSLIVSYGRAQRRHEHQRLAHELINMAPTRIDTPDPGSMELDALLWRP